ncbi:MAG: ferrous iron transport protein B [Bacteroidales bacterium]|jgi:ferrous iron transport protein B|nr:ferrous iron transport protein B [Bacteroidales bacterium]
MHLSDLNTGEKGIIVKIRGRGSFRNRILDMGFIKGQEVEVILNAPLEDPIKYKVMDYEVSLRRSEAALIDVVMEADAAGQSDARCGTISEEVHREFQSNRKIIHVALVGNPNAGKTSLFNVASGAHEHVGNYSGVTVDAKEGHFRHKGYSFRIVDLPGTYSLSSYSPEEIFVRRYLMEQSPDIVVNVVAASNLERNLYLTAQLIDMDTYMVIALNMYDELEAGGNTLNYDMLGKMIGAPMIPTVSTRGKGVVELFDRIIDVYEQREPDMRHIHINYGEALEESIARIRKELQLKTDIGKNYSKRYLAITLLEHNRETERFFRETERQSVRQCDELFKLRDAETKRIEALLNEDSEQAFTNARYGFIAGALKETFVENPDKQPGITELIDPIVTGKYFGYPIFLFFMWIMFAGTFFLGAYPKEWIETGITWLGEWAGRHMADGSLKDLLVDGIIGGVGGVIVFLPNIMILYLFIALLEDSGYMARAAFIMDKVMHKMGLHGKSFIPLIMGFGCSVPAIMSTRTIESRNSRMITMLVNPLISCSARLPVYILLVGAFFPDHPGWMMLLIYVTGIVLAVIMARVFKRFLFHGEDIPFVMELPPYRRPTMLSVFRHTWQKAQQYLRKMGGIIMIASVIIWFLGYFPRHTASTERFDTLIAQARASTDTAEVIALQHRQKMTHQEESYIGRIGKLIEPVLRPIGFDWKISVSLLTGMAAKEVVVSTLGVLYSGEEDARELENKLQKAVHADGTPGFTPLTAFCLMLFVLIYFPCIATITAIKNEAGSWKWGFFAIFYTTALAWIVSFAVYTVGGMFVG